MIVRCGSSVSGEYVKTVNSTDMSYGRQEGGAILARSREYCSRVLEEARKRTPFEWMGTGFGQNRASPRLKAGAGRLIIAFLRYHFNGVPGAYHGTNTAAFAVVIINLNPILITILCYG